MWNKDLQGMWSLDMEWGHKSRLSIYTKWGLEEMRNQDLQGMKTSRKEGNGSGKLRYTPRQQWMFAQCQDNSTDVGPTYIAVLLVCDLNRTPIVMAKHGGPCVHFSGISTCGRTSPETVSHPQRQPLPTPCKISLAVYVIVTNKRLQPLTTTLYNSMVLSFSLLKN